MIDMTAPDATAVEEVIAILEPNFTHSGDQYSMYASTSIPSGDESEWLDVLVQTTESQMPLGLWFGSGLPASIDDDGFAPEATAERDPKGNILAWLEEVRADEDGEPYELVRILTAYRIDGCVVTVNRYCDAQFEQPTEPWQFESLRQLALAPAWRSTL
jgi:hypothetical protein